MVLWLGCWCWCSVCARSGGPSVFSHAYDDGATQQGAIIAKGYERVGTNGQVVIEESPTMLDEIDFTEVRP